MPLEAGVVDDEGASRRHFGCLGTATRDSCCRARSPNDSVFERLGRRRGASGGTYGPPAQTGRIRGLMRIKIIAVNALIVTIVSLLSFLSVRSALGTAT